MTGLNVHMNQVHKETLTAIENALPNRVGLDVEIFGMEGIPEEIVQQHNQREVMTSLSQAILALIVPYLYTITPFRTPPVQAVVGRRGRLPHTRPYHANGSTLLNVGHSKTSVS